MKNNRELDKRDSIKVVTSNEFIKIAGLHKLSIKAIKEISETLNIDISYRSIKEGRKTIGFEFTLKNKHAI